MDVLSHMGRSLAGLGRAVRPAAVAFVVAALGVSVNAQDERTEYEIKAAFLYHFGQFVEWPADAFMSPTAPFHLCVVGDDPFGDTLDQTVSGKRENGHPITVRRLKRDADLRGCHIAFVGAVEQTMAAKILDRARGVPVLAVGESPQFFQAGGALNFVLQANKVRFDVNLEPVRRSRIHISSKLLSLARQVQGAGAN
jgi:hypothetical protein